MMASSEAAVSVYYKQELVGSLGLCPDLTMSFAYSKNWLESGFAVSWSLPLRERPFFKEAHTFFGNLLPEGDFRRSVERIFRVSADNDYSLLLAIGGDCAGALSIGEPQENEDAFYEEIDDEDLALLVKTEGRSALRGNGVGLRLSLAGAQGKIPLYKEGDRFYQNFKGAPSTHILKFNRVTGEFPHLIENEYLMNRCAFHAGLPVVQCGLMPVQKERVLVCERYDRSRDSSQRIQRLHQEDFCQALGISYAAKYEKEGGPSLEGVATIVRELGLKDFNHFIDWLLFNFLMSNNDAHGKNISILYPLAGAKRLAPFYDLVCTRAYPKVDRLMAMAMGGSFDGDMVVERHFQQLSRDLKVSFPFLRDRFKLLSRKLGEAMDRALDDLRNTGVKPQELQQVLQVQKKYFNKRNKIFTDIPDR